VPSQKVPQNPCLASRGLVLSSAGARIDAAMVDDARRLIANEVRTGNCIVIDKEGLRCEMVMEKSREMKGISLHLYIFFLRNTT
jgi:hypothetical protein